MVEWESLTIRELADRLQLHQATVRNWVNAGELEYIQVGRAKRIPRHAAVALAGGDGHEMPELMTVAQVAELLRVTT
jgi:excisionase family DNA binding protein